MSSLNSVSSLNFNPFQYLALLESQAALSGSGTTSTSSASGTTAASAASATTSGTTSLQAQLATAITSAVQTAEQSGNTSNLNSVIQGAVNQVFQENGINPATLQQDASGQVQGAPPPSPPSWRLGQRDERHRFDRHDHVERCHDPNRHGIHDGGNSANVQPADCGFACPDFRRVGRQPIDQRISSERTNLRRISHVEKSLICQRSSGSRRALDFSGPGWGTAHRNWHRDRSAGLCSRPVLLWIPVRIPVWLPILLFDPGLRCPATGLCNAAAWDLRPTGAVQPAVLLYAVGPCASGAGRFVSAAANLCVRLRADVFVEFGVRVSAAVGSPFAAGAASRSCSLRCSRPASARARILT